MPSNVRILAGFNPLRACPIDARIVSADQTTIPALTVYKGLVCYNTTTDQLFIYTGEDQTNVAANWMRLVATTAAGDLERIEVSQLTFNGSGEAATVNVHGAAGTVVNLSIINTDPMGWISSGALGATSGTIRETANDGDYQFSTTLTIPSSVVSVDRTFSILASEAGNPSDNVTSGLIRQQHTQVFASGNLTGQVEAVILGRDLTLTATILTGDPPYSLVLNRSRTDPTDNPIQSATLSPTVSARDSFTFNAIDTFPLPVGDNEYDIHVAETTGAAPDTLVLTYNFVREADVFMALDDPLYATGTWTITVNDEIYTAMRALATAGSPISNSFTLRFGTTDVAIFPEIAATGTVSLSIPAVGTDDFVFTDLRTTPTTVINLGGATITSTPLNAGSSYNDLAIDYSFIAGANMRSYCYSASSGTGISFFFEYVLGEHDSFAGRSVVFVSAILNRSNVYFETPLASFGLATGTVISIRGSVNNSNNASGNNGPIRTLTMP